MKKMLLILALVLLPATQSVAVCDLAGKMEAFNKSARSLAHSAPERLEALQPELEELAQKIQSLLRQEGDDPQRLDEICAIMDAMQALLDAKNPAP